MSTIIKRVVAIGAVGIVALASACGNSDDRANSSGRNGGDDSPPNGGGAAGGGGGGGGGGSPGGGTAPVAASFPLYVQRLIETSTTDTAMPEAETAWGSLADDESYVTPAGFFD